MPDGPDLYFAGALCEIWSGINYAAYHLAYVRIYLQTKALQTPAETIRTQEQALREMAQVDVVICRAHLAAVTVPNTYVDEMPVELKDAPQLEVRLEAKEN